MSGRGKRRRATVTAASATADEPKASLPREEGHGSSVNSPSISLLALPKDVFSHILSFVPVEYLARTASTSTAWRNLIKQDFVRRQRPIIVMSYVISTWNGPPEERNFTCVIVMGVSKEQVAYEVIQNWNTKWMKSLGYKDLLERETRSLSAGGLWAPKYIRDPVKRLLTRIEAVQADFKRPLPKRARSRPLERPLPSRATPLWNDAIASVGYWETKLRDAVRGLGKYQKGETHRFRIALPVAHASLSLPSGVPSAATNDMVLIGYNVHGVKQTDVDQRFVVVHNVTSEERLALEIATHPDVWRETLKHLWAPRPQPLLFDNYLVVGVRRPPSPESLIRHLLWPPSRPDMACPPGDAGEDYAEDEAQAERRIARIFERFALVSQRVAAHQAAVNRGAVAGFIGEAKRSLEAMLTSAELREAFDEDIGGCKANALRCLTGYSSDMADDFSVREWLEVARWGMEGNPTRWWWVTADKAVLG